MPATKDDVITVPNSHLRMQSQRVGLITPTILQVIDDMKNATISWEMNREHEIGVALAAVQIDQLYKIVVVRNNYEDKGDKSFTTFINPVITKLEGTLEDDFEGCLSIPDLYGKVPRYTKVRVKALDEQGREFRVTAEGFMARIFQHEIDHTKGILFIDYIRDTPNAFFHLTEEGKLEPVDYETNVKNNQALWGNNAE